MRVAPLRIVQTKRSSDAGESSSCRGTSGAIDRVRRAVMTPINRALLSSLAEIPRRLLTKLVEDKLRTVGMHENKDLAVALTKHMLTNGGKAFEWKSASDTTLALS